MKWWYISQKEHPSKQVAGPPNRESKLFIFFNYFLINSNIFNCIFQTFIDIGKFLKNAKQISTHRYDFMRFCRHQIHDSKCSILSYASRHLVSYIFKSSYILRIGEKNLKKKIKSKYI